MNKNSHKGEKKENRRSMAKLFFLFYFICPVVFMFVNMGESLAMPGLFIEEKVYNFGDAVEGEQISHDFIIENRGDTPLNLLKVRSSCGCTATSYTKEILPGEKGKISARFRSKGYGGRTVNKRIHVKTNDPKHSSLDLSITGHVNKIVGITPENIILKGASGKKIESDITITPDAGHPFRILEAKPKIGKYISCNLKKVNDPGPLKYTLTVTNLRKEKGRYSDYIYIRTDSNILPRISIRVKGDILE
ncbi:MAG: DUF1573 domain-containing protein [Desulfobacteraceae bacterium]|jgi:hypothetical protein